jgi:hypothetical protein
MAFLLLALPTAPLRGEADKADPRVYAPGAKVEGKTYAEWSAAWWQWALAIKKDRNPILDKDGADAAQGQAGPVWFLAGNTGGKTTRKCTVPAGKPVFFPVVNYVEGDAPDKADDKKLLAVAKAAMDGAADLTVTLDGKPIAGVDRFRVASAVFTFTGPEKAADALFEGTAGKNKAASDGYWLMLKPLATGRHTLHFKGKVKAAEGKEPLVVDVTYELTVEKK